MSNKITIARRREFIRSMLKSNDQWALRALVIVFDNQTSDEQLTEDTRYHNGIGFTGADARFLSSLAKQYQLRGRLSDKQLYHLHKKMPKYCRQILDASDTQKLDRIILAS